MKFKRIIFMGTPDYATTIFKEILEKNYNIIALFTQPDKAVGRSKELKFPHIKQFTFDNNFNIPIYQPESLKDVSTIQTIKDLNPDIIIVAAYGKILPKDILDIAPCVNLHASLLPKYRGASPIQQSLLNNDKYTGITAMKMGVGLDDGDILGLNYLKIDKDIVVAELFDKLSILAAKLTIKILEKYDLISPKKQNNLFVSHCGKITKSDGVIDFKDANDFYNRYRAYKNWPDIYLESKLKIKECKLIETLSNNKEGEILEINKENIIIGCNKGSICISEVQPNSKKQMKVVDYIRGKRLSIEDKLS